MSAQKPSKQSGVAQSPASGLAEKSVYRLKTMQCALLLINIEKPFSSTSRLFSQPRGNAQQIILTTGSMKFSWISIKNAI
ncbi:MAG: hypothetical protein JXR70_16055 [Spirochaetales bacterium]|nr:hypothetical protein [Spirochaetales bacterium]